MSAYVYDQVAYGVAAGTEGGYNVTLSLPAGLEEGDQVWVGMSCDGTPPQLIPEGYTSEFQSDNSLPRCSVSWKRMGSTPDSTFKIARDGTYPQAVTVTVVRGASTASDPKHVAVVSANTATGDPNPPAATVSGSPVDVLALAFGFVDDQDVASSVIAPTGYSDLVADDGGTGAGSNSSTSAVASKHITSAGTENPSPFLTPSSTEDVWGVLVILNSATTPEHTSTGAATLPAPVGAGTAERVHPSTGASTLPALTGAGTAERIVAGTGAGGNLPVTVGVGAAERSLTAAAATGIVPVPVGSGAAERALVMTGVGIIRRPVGSGPAKRTVKPVGAGVIPVPAGAGVGGRGMTTTGAGTLPVPAGDGFGYLGPGAIGHGILPALTGAGAALRTTTAVGSSTLPVPVGSGHDSETDPFGGGLRRSGLKLRINAGI